MRAGRDDAVRRLREGARIDAEPGEGVEQDRGCDRAPDQSGHGAVIGAADPDADRVPAVEADGPDAAIVAALEGEMPCICAECSGWGAGYDLELDDAWQEPDADDVWEVES